MSGRWWTVRGILNPTIAAFSLSLGLFLAHAFAAGLALADDPGDKPRPKLDGPAPTTTFNAWAETRPDGVHLGITVRETAPGRPRQEEPMRSEPAQSAGAVQPVANSSVATSVDTGRTWMDVFGVIHHELPDGTEITVVPAPRIIGWASLTTWEKWMADHPGESPVLVYVDDRFSGVVWIPGGAGDLIFDPVGAEPTAALAIPGNLVEAIDPMDVVQEILGFLPLPAIQVRMNPPLGLVALSSWYWVDGYDGRPFGGSKTIGVGPGAVTIEVRVWPSRYEWSFGDGASFVSQTLGQRYPAESEIKHTYEYSSFTFREGYPVRLTVQFEAEYRINNEPWQPLAPIRQTYGTDYPVQELQTVLSQP